MHVFTSASALIDAAGIELGVSSWLTVDQARIDRFADATDDHQWIHVDRDRAADGPFGSTIAHGYLVVSLLPKWSWETYRIEGAEREVNIGSDTVRFVHPVTSGARVRCHTRLASAVAVGTGAVQYTTAHKVTVDVAGRERIACRAEAISRAYFA